jgi:hypothetical protein
MIDEVKDLVGVFYHPPFKVFPINSEDGKLFTKISGVFVSLGITTSMKVINSIKDAINSTKKYKAELCELCSKKSDISSQYTNFLNTVKSKESDGSSISQYFINSTDLEEERLVMLTREDAVKECDRLTDSISCNEDNANELEVYSKVLPAINKLRLLISKIDSECSWDNYGIYSTTDGDYKLFHKFVNYKNDKANSTEYRVGILVEER